MRRRSRMSPARKLACVVLAVAVVASVVYATGAFTSTTASRSADIEVAGHGSAFLSLQPSEGPNGKFASYGPMGALQVKIGGAGLQSAATGVNPDSKTVFKNVFTITNNGSQPVAIWITGHSKAVTFRAKSTGILIEGQGNSRPLPVGETLHVGFVIDTRGGGVQPGTNLLKSVTIHTNANNKAVSEARENTKKAGSGGSSGGGSGDGTSGDSTGSESTDTNEKKSRGWPGDENGDSKNSGGDDGASSDSDGGDGVSENDRDENADCGDDLICQLRNDVDNVVDFLQEHPKLLGVLSPGMEIATWVYENRDKALNLVLGALLGAFGMPEGELSVPESGSLAYFAGWMAVSFAPGIDIAADIRDTIQAAINLNLWETALGLVAIIPGVGKVGDLGQIAKYTSDWLGAFGKVAELRRAVTSGLLSKLPDDISRVIISKTAPASVKQSDLTSKEWAKMVNNGHSGVRIGRLLDGGMSAEDIRFLTKKGDNAYNTRFDASMSVGGRKIQVGDGMSLKQVETLQNQGFSADDIRFFVEKGVSLKLVSALERIPGVSPKNVRHAIERFGLIQTGAGGAGLYGDIREWCGLNGTSSPICS